MSRTSTRKKVLFFAEAVTLAHIGRPLALAAALGAEEFDVALACDPRAAWALGGFRGRVVPIRSIPSAQFLHALAVGRPVYDETTLTAYVEEDLKVLEDVRPDVVVGDFRLSLSVSARHAGVRYLAISNAYWSPYYSQARYVIPEHPATQFVPVGLASAFFRATRPAFFALHSRPLNRVRRRFGMPSLGGDLRRIYTDADQVLYADVPELFPLTDAPPTHEFLGPIVWSPPVGRPDWWDELPLSRPLVYVTFGSSGKPKLLDQALAALAPLELTVIAATASDRPLVPTPVNAKVVRYLSGDAAAHRAALVICNGGSPTSQQALAAGVPVVGIASNLDQFLNMEALVRLGAGRLLRGDRASIQHIRAVAIEMLSEKKYADRAKTIAGLFKEHDARTTFVATLEATCKDVRDATSRAGPKHGADRRARTAKR